MPDIRMMSYEVSMKRCVVSPVIGPSVLRCNSVCFTDNHDCICAGTVSDGPERFIFYFCTLKQRMVFMHASARRGCLHLIKNTVQFVKYQYDVKTGCSLCEYLLIKAVFFSIITRLQCHMIFRNHIIYANLLLEKRF